MGYLGAACLPGRHLEPISVSSQANSNRLLVGFDGLLVNYARQPLPVRGCHQILLASAAEVNGFSPDNEVRSGIPGVIAADDEQHAANRFLIVSFQPAMIGGRLLTEDQLLYFDHSRFQFVTSSSVPSLPSGPRLHRS